MAKICEEEGWEEEGAHCPRALPTSLQLLPLTLTWLCAGEDMFCMLSGVLVMNIPYYMLVLAGC